MTHITGVSFSRYSNEFVVHAWVKEEYDYRLSSAEYRKIFIEQLFEAKLKGTYMTLEFYIHEIDKDLSKFVKTKAEMGNGMGL